MVKPYHVAPKDSAHTYLNGYFDYNDMPLSPLGCKVHLYVKTHKRKAWDQHSTAEYYVGTSDENYIFYNIWVSEAKAEIVMKTVFFKYKYIT